jgi:hypothetical protein
MYHLLALLTTCEFKLASSEEILSPIVDGTWRENLRGDLGL